MHGVTFPPRRFGLQCLGSRRHNTGWRRSQDITGSGSSLAPWQRLPAPSFCQRAHVFIFERPTLRVGHSALGCNNRKANATLTTVWLDYNKIGDRGAVALAGAIQALLATVFFVSSTQSVLAVWSR